MTTQNPIHYASEIFYELLRSGRIDKYERPDLWSFYKDPEVKETLDTIIEANHSFLANTTDRAYLMPLLDNEVFLKTNMDFRKDISADSDARATDVELLKYMCVYLMFIFFSGKGTDPTARDFISKEEFIKEFNSHMSRYLVETPEFKWSDYANNFVRLANYWLNKPEGDPASRKFNERYGMLNRILIKLNQNHDDLFFEENGNIRPSRKIKDLMPYLLRKDRIAELYNLIEEVDENA